MNINSHGESSKNSNIQGDDEADNSSRNLIKKNSSAVTKALEPTPDGNEKDEILKEVKIGKKEETPVDQA